MMKINFFLLCLIGLICLVPTGVLSKDDTCCPENAGFNCICNDNDIPGLDSHKPPCDDTTIEGRCPQSYECAEVAVTGNPSAENVCCQTCGELDNECIDFSNDTNHCGYCGNNCPLLADHTEIQNDFFCENYECCDSCGQPDLTYVATEDNYITGCPDQIYDAKFCGSCDHDCFSGDNLEAFRDQIPALSTSSQSSQEIKIYDSDLDDFFYKWIRTGTMTFGESNVPVIGTPKSIRFATAGTGEGTIYTELAAIYKDRTQLELIFPFVATQPTTVTIFFAVQGDDDLIIVAEQEHTFDTFVLGTTDAYTFHLITTIEQSSQFAGEVIIIGFELPANSNIHIIQQEPDQHNVRVVELNSNRAHWFSKFNVTIVGQDSRLPDSVIAACAAIDYEETTFWNALERTVPLPSQSLIGEQQYIQSTFCGSIGCNNDTSSARNSPCCPVCDSKFIAPEIPVGSDISDYKGDFCVDLFNDNANCGVCGNLCENIGDGFTCHGGRCCDACGTDECKDLDTDINHCGHCDVQCDPGTETCIAGSCVPSCPARCKHCVKRFTEHSECEREVEWKTNTPGWCLNCCDGCCDPDEQTCSLGIPFKIE